MADPATGRFDVEAERHPPYHTADGVTLGRTILKKAFEGDLVATSEMEMLSAGTPVAGSAGYVAIERVVGVLHGRKGTFVLQHSGTLTRGTPILNVTVVPDSGTGALTGLSGRFDIHVEKGEHTYVFHYDLG